MEQIGNNIEKAISTLTSIKESLPQKAISKKKPKLDWLPEKYIAKYESTNLLYSFCVEVFSKVEANMREDIPETTMRSWFIEFIKAGWTKEMVIRRYDGLIRNKKYGTIDFSSWVNAVPVFGEDEVNVRVRAKIDSLIQRGKYLLENWTKATSLTTEDKEAAELALEQELSFAFKNEKLNKIDEYKEKRRAEIKRDREKAK